MEVAFNAGDGVDAEFGRGLDLFSDNHSGGLVEVLEVDWWFDGGDALFQWALVNEDGKGTNLDAILAGGRWQLGDD